MHPVLPNKNHFPDLVGISSPPAPGVKCLRCEKRWDTIRFRFYSFILLPANAEVQDASQKQSTDVYPTRKARTNENEGVYLVPLPTKVEVQDASQEQSTDAYPTREARTNENEGVYLSPTPLPPEPDYVEPETSAAKVPRKKQGDTDDENLYEEIRVLETKIKLLQTSK